MPDLSPTLYVLIGWVLLLAIIVGFVALAGRNRARRLDGFLEDLRMGPSDRRTAPRDRRIGLPDHRIQAVERRSRSADRRAGSRDRRRSSPAAA